MLCWGMVSPATLCLFSLPTHLHPLSSPVLSLAKFSVGRTHYHEVPNQALRRTWSKGSSRSLDLSDFGEFLTVTSTSPRMDSWYRKKPVAEAALVLSVHNGSRAVAGRAVAGDTNIQISIQFVRKLSRPIFGDHDKVYGFFCKWAVGRTQLKRTALQLSAASIVGWLVCV